MTRPTLHKGETPAAETDVDFTGASIYRVATVEQAEGLLEAANRKFAPDQGRRDGGGHVSIRASREAVVEMRAVMHGNDSSIGRHYRVSEVLGGPRTPRTVPFEKETFVLERTVDLREEEVRTKYKLQGTDVSQKDIDKRIDAIESALQDRRNVRLILEPLKNMTRTQAQRIVSLARQYTYFQVVDRGGPGQNLRLCLAKDEGGGNEERTKAAEGVVIELNCKTQRQARALKLLVARHDQRVSTLMTPNTELQLNNSDLERIEELARTNAQSGMLPNDDAILRICSALFDGPPFSTGSSGSVGHQILTVYKKAFAAAKHALDEDAARAASPATAITRHSPVRRVFTRVAAGILPLLPWLARSR